MTPNIPRALLWDRNWKYTPSALTDITKTFARVRKEMAAKAKPSAKVAQIRKSK